MVDIKYWLARMVVIVSIAEGRLFYDSWPGGYSEPENTVWSGTQKKIKKCDENT